MKDWFEIFNGEKEAPQKECREKMFRHIFQNLVLSEKSWIQFYKNTGIGNEKTFQSHIRAGILELIS